MKNLFKQLMLSTVAAIAMLATSCSDEFAAADQAIGDELSGDRTITFTATVEAETRGYASISLFDYYRIYAYNTVEGLFIDGAEMKFADNEWTIDATYEMPGSGTSYFFAVSDQDIEKSGVTFVEDGANSYIDYTMPTDVANHPTLLMAKSEESDGSSFVINFAFKYILTPVALEASGDYYTVEEVTLKNYYNRAQFSFSAGADGSLSTDNISYPISTKDGSYTIAPNPGVVNGAITNATSGWLMMPPQSTEGFVLDITSYHYDDGVKDTSDTNGVREATISGDNIAQLEMGSPYTFEIGTNQIISESEDGYEDATGDNDYTNGTKTDSNCYIITTGVSTEQVYHIPIEGRINDFWTNYSAVSANQVSDTTRAALTVEQLWYDSSSNPTTAGMEVSLVMKDDEKVMQVIVPANYSNIGNTVYAVKNAAGTILWSWHLWMTNYTPTTTYLDRYVGQRATTSITGATLYQFGRKDPFVNNVDGISSASGGTYANSVRNPMVMYTKNSSSYSWASDYNYYTYYNWGDVNNKTLSSKSIYDPSPYGYRLLQYSEANTVVSGAWPYSSYSYYLNTYVYMRPTSSITISGFTHSLMSYESAFWTTAAKDGLGACGYLARLYLSGSFVNFIDSSNGQRYYAYPVLSIQE